jgi:tRNA-2-methylthio-N6-dimethylallyladenosine synthase
MPTVYIKTYGCQMNERDSEAVAAQLVAKGYQLVNSEAEADVILLNTCSVRDAAEQKALGKMRMLVGQTKRRKPHTVLGFLGCMAQARGRTLLADLPEVDLVVGTQKFHRVGEHLDAIFGGGHDPICDIDSEAGSESAINAHLSDQEIGKPTVRSSVSIMQGCNQRCTFCIVPDTRGPERNRSIAEIVAECAKLGSEGVKEVVLLGQIVTSYGRRDIPEANGLSPFVQLLEAVNEIPGIERIRFTSPHPKGYGDDLIEAYGRLSKLCAYAHIPVQSGSNRILKLMHRGYTVERFLEIVRKLRAIRPQIGLSTDLIVGFPGETEQDFEDTLALASEAQFDTAFMYKYSPRQGTPAASFPDQIDQNIKEERHARLLTTVDNLALKKYQQMVGSQVQILVEGPSRRNASRLEGRTQCNKIVVFEGSAELAGRLVDLTVTRAGMYTLYAEPL